MAKDSIDEAQSENTTVETIPIATAGTPLTQAEPTLDLVVETERARPSERREIVKSATLVMLGNLGSSVMGMVRQIVVTGFGKTIAGPFNSALLPAQTFNDFLINGSVSGALIPTFNDYSAPEKRDELRRLVFTLVNLVALVMLAASILFLFISSWFVVTFFFSGYIFACKAL